MLVSFLFQCVLLTFSSWGTLGLLTTAPLNCFVYSLGPRNFLRRHQVFPNPIHSLLPNYLLSHPNPQVAASSHGQSS